MSFRRSLLQPLQTVGLSGVLLFILFCFSTVIYFSHSIRAPLRKYFAPAPRKILSVASGPVLPGENDTVVKVKTPDGLFLEIYGPIKDGVEPLIQKIKLPDPMDAQFQFRGRATDLALKDLNNDGVFEIIAPTYDSSLVPHLNIYQYNKAAKSFAPYEAK